MAEDLGQSATARAIVNVMKAYGYKVLLWFAIPCTGGCSYQKALVKRNSKAKDRLRAHLSTFTVLWEASAMLMTEAKLYKSLTSFEWPTGCDYWDRPYVQEHMREMEYAFVDFHGCMFGLKSVARATKGLPIRKPWTVATDCPELAKALDRKCVGGWRHVDPVTGYWSAHASCSGVNTKITESYTDEMAQAIHAGHRKHIDAAMECQLCESHEDSQPTD